MKVRPLTGQVLIEVLPPDAKTDGGLFIPDVAQTSPRGEKGRPFKARVLSVGPWRKTRKGLSVLPDVHAGNEVLVSFYGGQKLSYGTNEKLMLVKADDLLAIVEP